MFLQVRAFERYIPLNYILFIGVYAKLGLICHPQKIVWVFGGGGGGGAFEVRRCLNEARVSADLTDSP